MNNYPDVLVARGAIAPSGIAHKTLAYLTRQEFGSSRYIVHLGDDLAKSLRRHLSPSNANRVDALPLWRDPALTPWPEGSFRL